MKSTPFLLLIFVLAFSVTQGASSNFSIAPETEGMEGVSLGNGTYLTASPTYVWNRPIGSDGIHSIGEMWSPEKLRLRLLMNRFSITPSWELREPGVWMSTGNEIGDMIYQDLLTEKNEANRTPLLEAGFRSKDFRGFFATARFFQVDHYSVYTFSERKKWVSSPEYSWFGENLPFFSTAYAGLGYQNHQWETSVLVGKEYLWIFGESGRWIPVALSPRVHAEWTYGAISADLNFQKEEYENVSAKESGERKEFSGSFRYACSACQKGMIRAGGGLTFRATAEEGDVYFLLEDDFLAWPFIEMVFDEGKRIFAGINFGKNERDWLMQDSVEYKIPDARLTENWTGNFLLGLGNRAGSRLNPLGDSYEIFEGDTISLFTSGYFQIHRLYLDALFSYGPLKLGAHGLTWAEYGAETFDTLSTETRGRSLLRYGDVGRIRSWIYGISGELRASFFLRKLFYVEARGGFEQIRGEKNRFEVNPIEGFFGVLASWDFQDHLKIVQSLNYRSDARWNLRTAEPFVVKGAWFWNLTVEENFPEYGLSLSGTLLHILGHDFREVPGGGEDRTRFYCTVRKNF